MNRLLLLQGAQGYKPRKASTVSRNQGVSVGPTESSGSLVQLNDRSCQSYKSLVASISHEKGKCFTKSFVKLTETHKSLSTLCSYIIYKCIRQSKLRKLMQWLGNVILKLRFSLSRMMQNISNCHTFAVQSQKNVCLSLSFRGICRKWSKQTPLNKTILIYK